MYANGCNYIVTLYLHCFMLLNDFTTQESLQIVHEIKHMRSVICISHKSSSMFPFLYDE